MTKSEVYIEKAPNGDWLLLKSGERDELIAVRNSRFAIRIAKRQHDAGRIVFLTPLPV